MYLYVNINKAHFPVYANNGLALAHNNFLLSWRYKFTLAL
jgi:hypothetical protein